MFIWAMICKSSGLENNYQTFRSYQFRWSQWYCAILIVMLNNEAITFIKEWHDKKITNELIGWIQNIDAKHEKQLYHLPTNDATSFHRDSFEFLNSSNTFLFSMSHAAIVHVCSTIHHCKDSILPFSILSNHSTHN